MSGVSSTITRRHVLLVLAAPTLVCAQTTGQSTGSMTGPPIDQAADPARGEEGFETTVRRLIGDARASTGRVHIGLPEIAESGNSVPLAIRVDSPMSATDHVRSIHVVAERNPRPWVASFLLGPRCGLAQVQTYIRLRDSQAVLVLAQMSDGAWWSDRVNVSVIVGACESLSARY